MKKLVCAMVAAGAMMALAEEAACDKACGAKTCEKAVVAAAEAPKAEANREERRAKFMARMAEHKAAMEAKMLEIVKKYVPEEEKAKELLKELQGAMMPARRMPPQRKAGLQQVKPPVVPAAAKDAK